MLKRDNAIGQLNRMRQHTGRVFIIHYSCESFYDIEDGRTPRVTTIAVRSKDTGQTRTFSIHKVAEQQHVAIDNVEAEYDNLERTMLEEFFRFVEKHVNAIWVHWNMRDINYGFEAINHRYIVLGGNPVEIDDTSKIDLSRLLIDMYGARYIDHPRLEKLVKLNGMSNKDFLSGAAEAEAFKSKEYVKLHQSTLRKVDLLHTILDRSMDEELITHSRFTDIYGLSVQGLYMAVKDSWFFWLFSMILAALIGHYLPSLLN